MRETKEITYKGNEIKLPQSRPNKMMRLQQCVHSKHVVSQILIGKWARSTADSRQDGVKLGARKEGDGYMRRI